MKSTNRMIYEDLVKTGGLLQMQAAQLKKNKINLSDYPYQKDIELRLIMSELSVLEVNVIIEIVQGSLKTKITQLAQHLEVELSLLFPILDKLAKTQLFQIEKDVILVNKELRKYWENQIPKFSDDFRADMEFLKDLLNKVPIHVLPTWYSIPRSSDDIFSSIVEKYFLTPKIYRRYLKELTFDEPILSQIIEDVFNAPDYKIHAETIITKYALSRERFEEFMLHLEFNFVCCLSYNQIEDQWLEVITPFHEWRQYLRFQRDSAPSVIDNKSKVIRSHTDDFGFVQDLTQLLQHSIKDPTPVKEVDKKFTLPEKQKAEIFLHLAATTSEELIAATISRALQLQLVELKDHKLYEGKMSSEWQERHIQEQAITVYRSANPQNNAAFAGFIDRDLKETEKCLKRIAAKGWIYFDDFTKACTAPIGENEPVTLKKMGKRWKYHTPEYNEMDKEKLRKYIFEILFYSGITATGTCEGRLCFCLTPFGRMTLD